MFDVTGTRRWALSAGLAAVVCAALGSAVVAAPPTLQSVAVTPAARTLSVGQKQWYRATGTFSDGSTQTLGAAISDIAPGYLGTCVMLTRGGVDCWGEIGVGEPSLVPRPVKSITSATGLDLGYDHSCALLASGTVQCWGGELVGPTGQWHGHQFHTAGPSDGDQLGDRGGGQLGPQLCAAGRWRDPVLGVEPLR
jgi:hypothetical protein